MLSNQSIFRLVQYFLFPDTKRRYNWRLWKTRALPVAVVAVALLSGCASLEYPLDVYLGPPGANRQTADSPAADTRSADTPAVDARAGAAAAPHSFRWMPLYQGVDIVRFSRWDPPLQLWGARIDLLAPGISIVVTPSNGNRPLDTDGRTTESFLNRTGVQIAVNASPFAPVADTRGAPEDIVGISAADGTVYSPPEGSGGALVIDNTGRAWVVDQGALERSDAVQPGLTGSIRSAVGGFSVILRRGENLGSVDHRHPRTAAGVSADHRYLYLVVVDGRQLGWSVGVTTRELAAWLSYLGAMDGLNLDGGGSTALVAQDPNGRPLVVDSPIDRMVPGRLRVVGNNLGVRAAPLVAGREAADAALRGTLRHIIADPRALR